MKFKRLLPDHSGNSLSGFMQMRWQNISAIILPGANSPANEAPKPDLPDCLLLTTVVMLS